MADPGTILPLFEITCGVCKVTETWHGTSLTRFQKQSRKAGWSLTKQSGWVCRDCKQAKAKRT